MRRAAIVLVVLVALGSGAVACSDSGGDASVSVITDPTVPLPGRDEVADALVTTVIAPAYDDLAATTEELATSVDRLCAAPDDAAALEAAQEAWRGASAAWAVTRPFRFGPVMDLRAASDISYEVDPDKVDELLAGTEPVTPEALDESGADRRTLGGVELVLFAAEPLDERRCEFAVSASSLIADSSKEVADAWAAGPDLTAKDVIDSTVNGIVFSLAEISEMQLGKASGEVSGTPEFVEIDAGPAHAALDNMLAVLDGVDLAMSGGDAGHGIEDLITEQSDRTASRVITQLGATRAAIEAVPPPLAETTDVAPVSAAYEAALAPLTTMRTEVASLLGVTLTFGDADGDS